MPFKIIPGASQSLCRTCENGLVTERRNGQEEAHCHVGSMTIMRVPLDIIKCSDYEDKRRVSRYELEKVAWELKHDNSGRVVGFVPPKKEE